jgi:hypothetical protein
MIDRVWRAADNEGNIQRLTRKLDQFPVNTDSSDQALRNLVYHMSNAIGRRVMDEPWQEHGIDFDPLRACIHGVTILNAAISSSVARKRLDPIITDKRDMMLAVFSGIASELVRRRAARIYSVRRDLCTALRGTRLRGITQGDVTLPEPYVFVHLDDGQDSFCTITKMTWTNDEPFLVFCVGLASDQHRLDWRGNVLMLPASLSLGDLYDIEHPPLGRLFSNNDILATVNNALLYITNNEHDVVRGSMDPARDALRERMLRAKGPKREKLKARLREIPEHPVFTVGGTYIIDKRLTEGTGLTTGRHLNVRFIVAGHWRQQPCGAGGKQRKLIWIAPHWKGPELAPVTRSVGIVRQPVRGGA